MSATTMTPLPERLEWSRVLKRGMIAYLLSRVLVLCGVAVGITAHAIRDRWEDKIPTEGLTAIVRALDSWDGQWYLEKDAPPPI